MRYLARRDPHERLVQLLHQWSTAWTRVAMRTDKGKPLGIVPASVRFADEAINGDNSNWYQANMLWDYYDWEHYAGSLLLDQLLFTYTLTHDEQLLQPLFQTLQLIRKAETKVALTRQENGAGQEHGASQESQSLPNDGQPPAGSPAWAVAKLRRCPSFWSVVEQWRFLTGDQQADDLIMKFGSAYGRYRVSGDESHLGIGLQQLLEGVRYNTPLLTTSALYTDRVYVPGWELLKAMLTGDAAHNNSSPYHWVSWEKTNDDFTALVSDTGRDSLQIKLFSHAPSNGQVVMRLWQFAPGTYRLRCSAAGGTSQDEIIEVGTIGQRISLRLPSRRLLQVDVRREP